MFFITCVFGGHPAGTASVSQQLLRQTHSAWSPQLCNCGVWYRVCWTHSLVLLLLVVVLLQLVLLMRNPSHLLCLPLHSLRGKVLGAWHNADLARHIQRVARLDSLCNSAFEFCFIFVLLYDGLEPAGCCTHCRRCRHIAAASVIQATAFAVDAAQGANQAPYQANPLTKRVREGQPAVARAPESRVPRQLVPPLLR